MKKYGMNSCRECGGKLRRVKYVRKMPTYCPDCTQKINPTVRDIFKQMQANPTTPAPDEMWFEDDPRAVNEIEYGRVIKRATTITSSTTLGELFE